MSERIYSVVTPAHLHAFGGHPNYRVNQKKAGRDPSDCCALCGKACLKTAAYVMLSNVGEYITAEENNNSDDLGLYPVGSNCMRLLKQAGIPVYNTAFERV